MPHHRLFVYPDPLDQVDQVSYVKLFGITYKKILHFDARVNRKLYSRNFICSNSFNMLEMESSLIH